MNQIGKNSHIMNAPAGKIRNLGRVNIIFRKPRPQSFTDTYCMAVFLVSYSYTSQAVVIAGLSVANRIHLD
jgi:hypothetical protein